MSSWLQQPLLVDLVCRPVTQDLPGPVVYQAEGPPHLLLRDLEKSIPLGKNSPIRPFAFLANGLCRGGMAGLAARVGPAQAAPLHSECQSTTSLSLSGLIDQLEFEGFTVRPGLGRRDRSGAVGRFHRRWSPCSLHRAFGLCLYRRSTEARRALR